MILLHKLIFTDNSIWASNNFGAVTIVSNLRCLTFFWTKHFHQPQSHDCGFIWSLSRSLCAWYSLWHALFLNPTVVTPSPPRASVCACVCTSVHNRVSIAIARVPRRITMLHPSHVKTLVTSPDVSCVLISYEAARSITGTRFRIPQPLWYPSPPLCSSAVAVDSWLSSSLSIWLRWSPEAGP